ncbi:MAG: DUF1697 domain-containing protein [Thermoleophilia bacterium]|nr:DUF1697 domain-containing protein [Thermoleophilia bacterium]
MTRRTRQIALLRGINVGKNKRISMADLRALLTDEGFTDVVTLLQSGNVAFDGPASASANERSIEQAIEQRYGFDVGVIVRTAAQVATTIKKNPIPEGVDDPSKFVVVFLPRKIDAADLASVITDDVAPEQFAVAASGLELYLYAPGGLNDSTLHARLAKQDTTVRAGTARNWNTVNKLLDLAGDK